MDVVGDQPGQEGPAEHRRGQRVPPAVPEVVQQRADHRGEHGERHHGHQQVERDLAAGLAERHVEEDRAGQADGDQGVAGAGERVQVEQADHADLAAGTPGPGPAGPAGHPAAAAHRTAQQQTDGANAGADGPPEDGSPGAGVRRHVHHPRPSDPGTPHHCGERFPGSPCHPCEAHGEQWSGDQARLHPCRPSRPGLRRRRRGGPRRHHRGRRRRCRRPPAGRGRG